MTITCVAAADLSSRHPRVSLKVSPISGGTVSVVRVHDDGTQHPVFGGPDSIIDAGTWSEYDYHAPFNRLVRYVATQGSTSSVASNAVWLPSETVWLIHRSNIDLSVPVQSVTALGDQSFKSRSSRFDILGSATPVHLTDSPRAAGTGSLTVNGDQGSTVAVLALLADDGPILLNTPYGAMDVTWQWIQPLDVGRTNKADLISFARRQVTIPYEATTQPDLDLMALFDDDDLYALGWTADQAANQYARDFDMQVDHRLPTLMFTDDMLYARAMTSDQVAADYSTDLDLQADNRLF